MIIAFFGHSSFCEDAKYKERVMALLDEIIKDSDVEFYLGGYGGFDAFSYRCCMEYKKKHSNASLIFVTPYPDGERLSIFSKIYDATLYPPIEDHPKKYAVLYRNRYMADCADIVIVYIKHRFGGAFQAYSYAAKKKKKIYNIENFSKIT